jgi:uncharacterized SAM-binding protein YcdF (DUF218 family)
MRSGDVQMGALGRFVLRPWSKLKSRTYGFRRHALLLTLCAGLAVALLLGWGERAALLHTTVQFWTISSDELAPADAVAVLGGGSARPYAAAELYRRGFARRILFDLDEDRAILLALNVRARDVEEFGRGLISTYEESCALKDWAVRNEARRIIIPTEIFPSRRVKWIFDHQFGGTGVDVKISVLPIPRQPYDKTPLTADALDHFRTEIIKYGFYRTRYAFDHC